MPLPLSVKTVIRSERRSLRLNNVQAAFSLVEVVLAIGVMSFAMMAVLGTLPVGLKSSQQSRVQVASANIARQLQAELQQISFDKDSSDVLNMQTLKDNPFYFTLEGTRTTKPADAYYEASFVVNDISLPGLPIAQNNARNVTVTLAYPLSTAQADRQKTVFALLLARQKTD